MARQKPRERRPGRGRRGCSTPRSRSPPTACASSGIEVSARIDPDLPPVLADEDQLHQVFANLLVNAQQALRDVPPPRRIVLTAALERMAAVRVDVADTGPACRRRSARASSILSSPPSPRARAPGIGLSVLPRHRHGPWWDHRAGRAGGRRGPVRDPSAGSPVVGRGRGPCIPPLSRRRPRPHACSSSTTSRRCAK